MTEPTVEPAATPTRTSLLRRLVRGFLWLLAIVFVWGVWRGAVLFWPARALRISPSTTVHVEPLTPQGFVDYAALFNAKSKIGVTPKNNASVALLSLVGTDVIPADLRPRILEELGIDEIPDPQPAMVAYNEFEAQAEERFSAELQRRMEAELNGLPDESVEPPPANETGAAEFPEPLPFEDQLTEATGSSWKRDQYPEVAGWIDANAPVMDLLLKAMRQEHDYYPVVLPEGAALIERAHHLAFPGNGSSSPISDVIYLICAQGQLLNGSGDVAAAIDRAEALQRFGRLSLRTPQFEILGSVPRVESLAFLVYQGAFQTGVPATVLDSHRERLRSLEEPRFLLPWIDAERIQMVDAISRLPGVPPWPKFQGPGDVFPSRLFDVNVVLEHLNADYDRIKSILDAKEPFSKRIEQLDAISPGYPEFSDVILSLALRTRTQATHASIWVFRNRYWPTAQSMMSLDAATVARHRVVIAAFAIAAHVRDHGRPPESLAALEQELGQAAVDPFTDEPLRFSTDPDGSWRVYSVSRNGRDDAGENAQNPFDQQLADDLAITSPAK